MSYSGVPASDGDHRRRGSLFLDGDGYLELATSVGRDAPVTQDSMLALGPEDRAALSAGEKRFKSAQVGRPLTSRPRR